MPLVGKVVVFGNGKYFVHEASFRSPVYKCIVLKEMEPCKVFRGFKRGKIVISKGGDFMAYVEFIESTKTYGTGTAKTVANDRISFSILNCQVKCNSTEW